jgi:hypothetical protein
VRDADLQLYDAACQVLVAAQSLRETADKRRGEAAIAPTLGCLQATLDELEVAVGALSRRTRIGDPALRHRVRSALDDVMATLRLAGRAAEAARAAAAEAATAHAPAADGGRRRFSNHSTTSQRRRG